MEPYHRPMPCFRAVSLLAMAGLVACSPTFNWREVHVDPTPLKAMLPCKPESGSRRVQMGPSEVELAAVGCETGGATFAILHADLQQTALVEKALGKWSEATLANLKAGSSNARPFVPAGAVLVQASQRVSATGVKPDGSVVRSEAAYFARGSHVFQAVVYASDPKPEWLQPFFEGLRFE
jgi:hypothetical protein